MRSDIDTGTSIAGPMTPAHPVGPATSSPPARTRYFGSASRASGPLAPAEPPSQTIARLREALQAQITAREVLARQHNALREAYLEQQKQLTKADAENARLRREWIPKSISGAVAYAERIATRQRGTS